MRGIQIFVFFSDWHRALACKLKRFLVSSVVAISRRSMSAAAANPSTSRQCPFIPEAVRGITELRRELFSNRVSFPVVQIDARDCTAIRTKGGLEKVLIRNLINIKNVMDDPEDSTKKFLVFDPAVVADDSIKETIVAQISGVTEKEAAFTEREIDVAYENIDLRRAIRAVLPQGFDFSSFTQSGHLVHCNFRDGLMPYKKVLAELIYDKVSNCRTVVNKVDCIKSEYRNFELELLAGEPDYVVDVKEGGLTYRLDFSKVFWNTRLGHEHDRIVKLFDSRSLVYDACAGVGPFALPAAKKKACRKIFANDLNPESIEWLQENIARNKVRNESLSVFNRDAIEFLTGPVTVDLLEEINACSDPEWTPPSGAHILMNLPAYAINFLPTFRGLLHGKTTITELPFKITVYCYLFAKSKADVPDEWYAEKAEKMVMEQLQWPTVKIAKTHHVRTVSSRKEMFCVQMELPLDLLLAAPKDALLLAAPKDACGDSNGNGSTDPEPSSEPPEKKAKVDSETVSKS